MNTQHRGRAAFAVCGSFCTLGAAAAQAEQLVRQGWELLPVMSFAASRLDTRFGRASEWKERLEQLTGHPVLDSLQAVEPLGPKRLAEALVIAPCTGTTLARLAAGLSDTPVTLAAKSLLRVGCPVVVATPYSSRGVNRPSPPTTAWAHRGRTSPGCASASTITSCPTGRMTRWKSRRA